MNRPALYLALVLCITSCISAAPARTICDSCDCKATSKTFFSIRPPYGLDSPERLALFRDRRYACEDGHEGAWEVAVFGGRSTKKDRITSYFLPDCKTQLRVTEQQTSETDILASQLNIFTDNGDFDSTLSFCPRHRFAGVGFSYKQNFYEYCDSHALWLGLSFPVYNVKNDLNMTEKIANNGGGVDPDLSDVVATAAQAFQQATWKFGRIECCNKTVTRLGDVEVRLGYEFVEHPTCQLESFIGFLLPAGNKPKGIRVFEPIVGYNKHAAIFFGSSVGFEFWRDCTDEHVIWAAFDMSGQYFFKKTEVRSLDLKLKPWSRYMQVYCNEAQAQKAADLASVTLSTPGINVFTQKLQVNPGFIRVINTALIYEWCDRVEAEFGYNLYAREAECVKLDCPFRQGMALKAIRGLGFTNNVQQIGNVFGTDTQNAPNDVDLANFSDNILTKDDLDLESASHPCVLEHTLYVSAGHKWDDRCYPLIAGGGASYQFTASNAGLSKWTLWAKFGMSF